VIGKKYNNTTDFYTSPSQSSFIGILLVTYPTENYSFWPISDILYKWVSLPYNIIPLLHTDHWMSKLE